MLPDAAEFLNKVDPGLLLGITSNTPSRHADSVLPMLGVRGRAGRDETDPVTDAATTRRRRGADLCRESASETAIRFRACDAFCKACSRAESLPGDVATHRFPNCSTTPWIQTCISSRST